MFYPILPFIAAALYALDYVLIKSLTDKINMTTYYIVSLIICLFLALGHGVITKERISLDVFKSEPVLLYLIIIAAIAGSIAWVMTTYTIKNISAHYAAFGEVSYPVFTLIFTYLLLGVRQFDLTSVIGGLLVVAGSSIMIYGRVNTGE